MSFRWKQLDNSAIGNDIFPKLEYKFKDAEGKISQLGDSIVFDKKHSTFISCRVTPKTGEVFDGKISIYNGKQRIAANTDDKWAELILTDEENNKTLGIYVYKETKDGEKWIDFRWVTVSELSINPEKMQGEADNEYSWEASIANPPASARYEWNFGDNSAVLIKKNDKKASHTYNEDGIFPIVLQLFDDSNGQLVGVATAYANIGAGMIDTTFETELAWDISYDLGDNTPKFKVSIKGTINADDLVLTAIRGQLQTMPTMYIYHAKKGSDFKIELNCDYNFLKRNIVYENGNTFGVYKREIELQEDKTSLGTFINTPGATNIVLDTTGTRFFLKGTHSGNDNENILVIIYAKYNYKLTEYRRDDDGTESKEVYFFDDNQWHLVAVSIGFQ